MRQWAAVSCRIEFRHVTVEREGRLVLDDVSLSVEPGEAVAVIGRSGAGKTTILRLVNGLVRPSSGEILVDHATLAETDLVRLRRRIGYIVQGIGLLPHRTIGENVATVPRLLGWPEERIREATTSLLEQVALDPQRYTDRYPSTLSGGEQQRAGIARALVFDPDVLLCDEPFGALDPLVRREQQELFLRLGRERGVTMLFVTHDLAEALFVSDRVVLIDGGRIVAAASSKEFPQIDHPLARRFLEASRLGEGAR